MKKRGFWVILLAVVAAVVVLGVIGFGFMAMRMWGGRYNAADMMRGDYGRMPGGYGADMPCEEEDGGTACTDAMPYGAPLMRGMPRMPYARSPWGMHSDWHRHGSSFLTNLLLLGLIVVGILNLGRWHKHTHKPTVQQAANEHTEE